MLAARELVERAAHGTHEHTYGINTGFGRFVSQVDSRGADRGAQLRLLRSHACGVGDPYPDEIVRAAMLLRGNALAKGNSGARIQTVELLLECLVRACCRAFRPGSVGASGDLAPLAHLALPLVGEGEAWHDGALLPGADALAAAGLDRPRLAAKEGLSLVNGRSSWRRSARSAWCGRVGSRRRRTSPARCRWRRCRDHARASFRRSTVCVLSADSPSLQRTSSTSSKGSAINEAHRWCDKVQDAYSLRCAPQVHGASRDLLAYVEGTVAVELNSATDNPLVLVEDELLVSNGNFHGQPLAFALDALAMASSELANISERRVERLVNPNLSDGLPAFLTVDGGLNSGFMIPQYVAASLVSENKSLCHPASVDSIPTSAGQEDHVSMGNAAGLKAWQVLANSERALAIELLAGAQAVEFLAPLEPGHGSSQRRTLRPFALPAPRRRPVAVA